MLRQKARKINPFYKLLCFPDRVGNHLHIVPKLKHKSNLDHLVLIDDTVKQCVQGSGFNKYWGHEHPCMLLSFSGEDKEVLTVLV